MYSTKGIAKMSHVLDGINGGVSAQLRGVAGALQKWHGTLDELAVPAVKQRTCPLHLHIETRLEKWEVESRGLYEDNRTLQRCLQHAELE
jgi:hypothetical protein